MTQRETVLPKNDPIHQKLVRDRQGKIQLQNFRLKIFSVSDIIFLTAFSPPSFSLFIPVSSTIFFEKRFFE